MVMRLSRADITPFNGLQVVKYEITHDDTLLSTVAIRSMLTVEIRTQSEVLSIKPKEDVFVSNYLILSHDGNQLGEIKGMSTSDPKIIFHNDQGDQVWRCRVKSPSFFTRLFSLRKPQDVVATFVSGKKNLAFDKINYKNTTGSLYSNVAEISSTGVDVKIIAIATYVLELLLWSEEL